MGHCKHNEGITSHLQRIFIYGDEMAEGHRVNSFLDFLSHRINPFTQRPYDLGPRSLYHYISGEHQFPADLLPVMVSWSLDERLMSAFNIYPVPDEAEKLRNIINQEEQEIERHQEKVRMLRSRLAPPMKGKGVKRG